MDRMDRKHFVASCLLASLIHRVADLLDKACERSKKSKIHKRLIQEKY
jgi:hypothetical protein